MTEATRIVLAVRVGKESELPARTAAWLASTMQASIVLVHVAEALETVREVAVGGGLDEAEVRRRMIDEARVRADELATSYFPEVPHEVRIVEGSVGESVRAVAERVGASLIVVGSRGRSAVGSVLLGDTTREILREATRPVVVVPKGASLPPPAGGPGRGPSAGASG